MRKYKFRAWDKVKKEWAFDFEKSGGFHLFGELHVLGYLQLDKLNDYEVTQFTGLKDKNSKEIYEGDIVQNESEYYPINPVIYYNDIINFHDGDWDEWYCGFCLDDVDHTPLSDEVEVIGNIYENPELLEVNK